MSSSWKVNFEFLDFSSISMIFQNCCKNWIFNIFKIGITIFEKNSFTTSTVSDSLLINHPFLLRWILSLFIILLDRRVWTVFHIVCCLLCPSHLNFHSNLFEFFSNEEQIYCFAEYIRDNFLPFYVLIIYSLILIFSLSFSLLRESWKAFAYHKHISSL